MHWKALASADIRAWSIFKIQISREMYVGQYNDMMCSFNILKPLFKGQNIFLKGFFFLKILAVCSLNAKNDDQILDGL